MSSSSDTPWTIRLAHTAVDYLPPTVETALSPAYCRYQSWRADRAHARNTRFRAPTSAETRSATAPEHVLVVVVDALRPDHVPNLPLRFNTTVTPGAWTFPAVTSLHTGLYPHEHGAVAHSQESDEHVLPEQTDATPTLPETLEQAGYDTYSGCSFIVPFLALRGWYNTHRLYRNGRAVRIVGDYLRWRSRAERDRTFAYLHLSDLHIPIEPPTEYVERREVDTSLPRLAGPPLYLDDYDDSEDSRYYREHRLRLYRAALDYTEDVLDSLLERVAADTLVCVTGDHGESMWEHYEVDRRITDPRESYGYGHGGTPFDMTARVPVALQRSGGEALLPRGGWPSLRDLLVTIANEVLDNTLTSFPGREWQTEIPADRAVLCEGTSHGVERKAVYRGEHKLIRSEADDVTLTFQVNREESGERPCEFPDGETTVLLAELPDDWSGARTERSTQPDAIVNNRLEALGYR